jgi:hypothetical protein
MSWTQGAPRASGHLLGAKYRLGGLFRTTAGAFRFGAAWAQRCSDAVQVEGSQDSMEHEHHLTCKVFPPGCNARPLCPEERVIV